MSTVPQNSELLNQLKVLLMASRSAFRQQRVYKRAIMLVLGEVLAVARHTVTQLLMVLGLSEQDWSAWCRLFSQRRFDARQASAVLVARNYPHCHQGRPILQRLLIRYLGSMGSPVHWLNGYWLRVNMRWRLS